MKTFRTIAEMLRGGDRRSIGNSNQVVKLILRRPRRFAELFHCIWHENAIVRLRAADAAEKITLVRPQLLKPFKRELLGLLAEADQIELRWHLALMVPRLALTWSERQCTFAVLDKFLQDRSSIVKTCALEGLTELAKQDPRFGESVRETLEASRRAGTPAMKARARKLLTKIGL